MTTSFSTLARGSKQHNERERSLANTMRRESLQLECTLRLLGLQYQRELGRVCEAQLKVRRGLDRLGGHFEGTGHDGRPTAVHVATAPAQRRLLHTCGPLPPKPCCPNHIVCSTCNLRLRLADTVTRRFTPSLWTMYCRPPSESGRREAGVYRMPSFVACRNLSASENSLRYLPFM